MKKNLTNMSLDRVLTPLVLSVVLSFAAGIVGSLFFMANSTTTPSVIETVTVPRASLSVTRVEAVRLEATDSAQRAAVTIFLDKGRGQDGNIVYVGSEALGSGLILTSDGWVVTHELAMPDAKKNNFVALVGGVLYPIADVFTDSYSGAAFFKVPATNLSVASFTNRVGDQAAGKQLFALDPSGGVRDLRVVAESAGAVSAVSDLNWSSESLNRFLLCDSEHDLLPGAMVMNDQGETVGIAAEGEQANLLVVPVGSFVDIVDQVFKGRGAVRPYLGVNYLDLSEPVAMTDGALPRRGALLTSSADGRHPAIAKGSPAAGANLREGDIILSVNGELVSERRTLSDIIATYFPGMNVALLVKRRGIEISVNLTLGEQS